MGPVHPFLKYTRSFSLPSAKRRVRDPIRDIMPAPAVNTPIAAALARQLDTIVEDCAEPVSMESISQALVESENWQEYFKSVVWEVYAPHFKKAMKPIHPDRHARYWDEIDDAMRERCVVWGGVGPVFPLQCGSVVNFLR